MEKGTKVTWRGMNNQFKEGTIVSDKNDGDFVLVAVDQRKAGENAQAIENAKLWADERPVVMIRMIDLYVSKVPQPALPSADAK